MTTKIPGYMTVKEVAETWGVTRRYVNMCIEGGRIRDVVKTGNMWLIPSDTGRLAGRRREKSRPPENPLPRDLAEVLAATLLPMPRDNPDAILDTINAERLRLPYEAELAYLRGDFGKTRLCFQKAAGDAAVRLRVSPSAIAAAISVGDYPSYVEIEAWLKAIIKENMDADITAVAEQSLATAYVSAIAPDMVPVWIKDGDFSALHPLVKPDALHKRAKYFLCCRQYESALAVAQTALAFCDSGRGILSPNIYLLLMCAIACCALERQDEAKRYLLEAMDISLPHGFITPFAEHAAVFGGLLERLLERKFSEYYKAVTGQWQRTFINWRAFHNSFTKDNITLMLSLRDYELASLIARRVPYAKIAGQFNISVGRLKNKMNEIYSELSVNNRDELAKLIL